MGVMGAYNPRSEACGGHRRNREPAEGGGQGGGRHLETLNADVYGYMKGMDLKRSCGSYCFTLWKRQEAQYYG